MLENDLYNIGSLQTQDDGKHLAIITLNPSHQIFQGHFPDQPILPGVCLIEILKVLVGKVTGNQMKMHSAATIKFVQAVDPKINPVLKFEIVIRDSEKAFQVSATSFLQDGTANFKLKGYV